jgi:hypothetical protein
MKAKTIIENKFWVLEEDSGERVGTIAVRGNTVNAVIKDQKVIFQNLEELQTKFNIAFTNKSKLSTSKPINEIYDYPTAHKPHNALWHVEKRLPIYTKTDKSNSYHCAGYYIIKASHGWLKRFSPKLITLQRYEYRGPFKTKMEMLEQLRLYDDSI